jgi:serine/threonine protein kinase
MQVLEALCHSHANQVIHTDVKPENVLFQEQLQKLKSSRQHSPRRPFPADAKVKLVDFGSAVYDHSSHASVVSTRHYR